MKKPMTIETLAIMVANGFKEVHVKFDLVDQKFEKLEEKLNKRIDGLEEKIEEVRKDLSVFREEMKPRVKIIEKRLDIHDVEINRLKKAKN